MNAKIGPTSPEIVESYWIGVDAVRADVLAAHVIVCRGLVHLHALGRKVKIEGGLEFVGVGHHFRLLDLIECVHGQPKVAQGAAKRVSFEHGFAGNKIDQWRV